MVLKGSCISIKLKKSLILSLIVLYSLFAINRIKYAFPSSINNMVIVILFCGFLVALLFGIQVPKKTQYGFLVIQYLLVSVLVSICNTENVFGCLYAFAQLVIPFLGFIIASRMSKGEFSSLFKFIIIVSGLYSLLTIVVASNYNYFAGVLAVDEIVSYSRFARINMPIGSSITVSYYLNITAPFCAIGIEKYKKNRAMRIISVFSLFFSLVCIVTQNSRAAIITMVITSFAFFRYYVKISRRSIGIGLYFVVAAIVIVYYMKYGNIERFFNRSSIELMSDLTRFDEFKKGLMIFLDHPIFGTGIGAVYNRLGGRVQYYQEMSILSDPHNAYVLLLSEVGIIGGFCFLIFFVRLMRRMKRCGEISHGKVLRRTLIISIVTQSLFGSHIINEPNYSVIFWILLGTTYYINREKEEMDW